MRVRISTNAPLPQVKVWLPLDPVVSPFVTSLKSNLVKYIPALHGRETCSLRLSIDGFQLLDGSDVSVVRDGDLICVDVRDATRSGNAVPRPERWETGVAKLKRKRRASSSSSSSSSSSESETDTNSGSESTTETDTDTSNSDSQSDSDESSRAVQSRVQTVATPSLPRPHAVHPTTFVPPGRGKPQTQARNLRRRRKRIHEREANTSEGPVSGANAVAPAKSTLPQAITPVIREDDEDGPTLLSLSLRNKNKAKNFKALMKKPLPPKIVFGDQEREAVAKPEGVGMTKPVLVPPSSRSSLPPNVFVTSIDVEAGMRAERKKKKMRIEYGDDPEAEDVDIDVDELESTADTQWDKLERATKQVTPGTIIGYKGLGINPVTYTPEETVTVGAVVSCEEDTVVVRPLRGISFSGPVDGQEKAYGWDEIEREWRVMC